MSVLVHCLTGPYPDVGLALAALPRSVVDRGWYALVLDVSPRCGVFLFTRTDSGDRVVRHDWLTGNLGDLPTHLLACATGAARVDDADALLRARCPFVPAPPVLAPITARGAFAAPFAALRGQWARALVLSS